ncbi:MAG TPA: methyl-accepting chemotaxis protein [Cyanobacteria bacterium UBA8803]|nr:methyl-accepting chemotaxis protein [Cyanobacteria bacterium UBA9273]HBL60331.1 methyl-accepting chemotaxis protein [Cyanobacteria bacterium UBA8803]
MNQPIPPKFTSQDSKNSRGLVSGSLVDDLSPVTSDSVSPSSWVSSSPEQQSIKPPKSESLELSEMRSLTSSVRQRPTSWWQKQTLRTKATTIAIAIGIIPVVVIGFVGYQFANRSITKQISLVKIDRAVGVQDKVARFMRERYGDIQFLANLPIFTDPKVSEVTPLSEKQAALNDILKFYKIYNSVAVFDLKGNVIVQSDGEPLENHSDRDYFQAVLKSGQPFISHPQVSKSTEVFSLYFAAPIKDKTTGKMIAIVRSRMPMTTINELIKNFAASGDEYHMIDLTDGEIFLTSQQNKESQQAKAAFPDFAKMQQAAQPISAVVPDLLDKQRNLVAYSKFQDLDGLPKLNWGAIIATPTDIAFEPQRQLLLTVTIGTVLTALLVAALAAAIANRATRPIVDAAIAVTQIGQGELDTRVEIAGKDELAVLGANINEMAEQIQTLLQEQARATEEQIRLKDEQRQQKEDLQKRALELLQEVDPISKGDLTIRAKVTADEIGTIADSYNATVGNLRKIVTQVQDAANLVARTTSSSETSAQILSAEALRQAEEIAAALEQVQEMAASVQLVAASAEQAEIALHQATETVQEGDIAMNRTVDGILSIRETVAETAKKVKHLGESSQKISTVVNLISTFAAQTNLLALNASIEAARAGEEGRGFAVVADEVRALARQSAEATTEIEKLVAAIQAETNEVVAAMESGTEQVVAGTKLVDETRESLNKITATSTQITNLVESIMQATVMQTQTSATVTRTMSNVAEIANKTSTEAQEVSSSFEELRKVAQALQEEVGQFKVS